MGGGEKEFLSGPDTGFEKPSWGLECKAGTEQKRDLLPRQWIVRCPRAQESLSRKRGDPAGGSCWDMRKEEERPEFISLA